MKRKCRILTGILIPVLLLTMGAIAFADETEEEWVQLYEARYYGGRLQSESEISYHQDGRINEYRTHVLNQDGTETLEIEVYNYDEKGRTIGTETRDAETEELLETTEWRYDNENRLHKILRYDAEGNLQNDQQNSYSTDGRMTIRGTTYDDNGDARSSWISRYNDKHENYYHASFDEDGEQAYVRETVFDADGRMVSGTEEGYGSRSSLRYLYDTDGVLQELIETQETGYSAGKVTRILYYYDEHGNVTEELTLADGEIISRTLRTWGLRTEVTGDGN